MTQKETESRSHQETKFSGVEAAHKYIRNQETQFIQIDILGNQMQLPFSHFCITESWIALSGNILNEVRHTGFTSPNWNVPLLITIFYIPISAAGVGGVFCPFPCALSLGPGVPSWPNSRILPCHSDHQTQGFCPMHCENKMFSLLLLSNLGEEGCKGAAGHYDEIA